jgi:hypothetical protein
LHAARIDCARHDPNPLGVHPDAISASRTPGEMAITASTAWL